MKFAFIDAESAQWPVALLCETLDVSRSGYYAWVARPEAPRVAADAAIVHTELVALHQAIHVRWPSEPENVRRSLARFSLRQEDLHEFLPLFHARIQQVGISSAQVAAALSARELAMSSVAQSSARRLVQRGLFDRRSEIEENERARVHFHTDGGGDRTGHVALAHEHRTQGHLLLCGIIYEAAVLDELA